LGTKPLYRVATIGLPPCRRFTFAKWFQIARFDAELGDLSDTHVPYITQMLDEVKRCGQL